MGKLHSAHTKAVKPFNPEWAVFSWAWQQGP